MKKIVAIILFICLVFLGGFRIYSNIILKQNVTGHLKRAADSNSIELALSELSTVLNYVESNGLTEGYTSVLYNTPDEDLTFWYENIKSSKIELENSRQSSTLEKTNVLLKLRESLVDGGEKGVRVTFPKGLAVFPHNKLLSVILIIALVSLPLGTSILNDYDKALKAKQKQKRKNGLHKPDEF